MHKNKKQFEEVAPIVGNEKGGRVLIREMKGA